MPIKITDETTAFSNKLIALTNRKATVARDLFDVYFFIRSGFKLKEEIIFERTGKELDKYLPFVIKFIKSNFTPKDILHGLGMLIDAKQKAWAKERLIEETIAELEKIISR